MTMVGADADRLDQAAAQLRRAADELDSHSAAIAQQLGGLAWVGQLATAFSNLWSSHHKPRLGSTARFIREAADKLTNHARQQREASAASAAAPAGAPPRGKPIPVERPATEQELKAAVERGLMMARTSRKSLPGAASTLEAWATELQTGEHSLSELQAFLKYREMVATANGLRATVQSAAESGIAARDAAVEGGIKVVVSAGLAVAGGESGIGHKVGGMDAARGGTIANVERVGKFADDAAGGELEAAIHAVREKAEIGISTGDPVAIRQAYEARADAFLVAAEDNFRASRTLSNTDPAQIRQHAISEYAGKYEVAVAQGDVASAFNLGPDWLTAPLSAGMNVLVPYSGTATFGVLGAAEASANALSSVAYLNVAADASMDQLTRSMLAMRL